MARRPPPGRGDGRGPVVPPARSSTPSRSQHQLLGVVIAGVIAAVAIVVGGIALSGGSASTDTVAGGSAVPTLSPGASASPTAAASPVAAAAPSAAPTPTSPSSSAAPTPSAAATPSNTPAPTQAAPPATGGTDAAVLAAPATSERFQGLAVGVGTEDVRTWQRRMAARGWDVAVDGIFGAQSQAATRAFQAEKGLAVDGIVGRATWDASWTVPVT